MKPMLRPTEKEVEPPVTVPITGIRRTAAIKRLMATRVKVMKKDNTTTLNMLLSVILLLRAAPAVWGLGLPVTNKPERSVL
jgi:hypothetical protein